MAKVKGIVSIVIGLLIAVLSFFTTGHGKENSTQKPGDVKKASSDTVSHETSTAVDQTGDWSTDYPKRPLKKGEHLPFPRPAVE